MIDLTMCRQVNYKGNCVFAVLSYSKTGEVHLVSLHLRDASSSRSVEVLQDRAR